MTEQRRFLAELYEAEFASRLGVDSTDLHILVRGPRAEGNDWIPLSRWMNRKIGSGYAPYSVVSLMVVNSAYRKVLLNPGTYQPGCRCYYQADLHTMLHQCSTMVIGGVGKQHSDVMCGNLLMDMLEDIARTLNYTLIFCTTNNNRSTEYFMKRGYKQLTTFTNRRTDSTINYLTFPVSRKDKLKIEELYEDFTIADCNIVL